MARPVLITPPEVANTGPGVNRGSGGDARGCGFEERVGVHARTGGFISYGYFVCLSACVWQLRQGPKLDTFRQTNAELELDVELEDRL